MNPEQWSKQQCKFIKRRWLSHDAFSPVRSITLRDEDLARDPALRVTLQIVPWAPGPGKFEHLCAIFVQFWRVSSPMGQISKVTNVSNSGPMSPIRLRACDAKILRSVLSAVISFFVARNMNHQMRLISKDLGKIVASKSNVWILSYDQNNNAKSQKAAAQLSRIFPCPEYYSSS